MTDLARLDYSPLKAHVSKDELTAFRTAREVFGYDDTTGSDEQKAPVVTGTPDKALWERRYRFNAFAEANGMSYSFRSDSGRWPGFAKGTAPMIDVLQGTTVGGQRFMACELDISRDKGAVVARDYRWQHYAVVAVHIEGQTGGGFFEHNWIKHPDAPELLDANYTAYGEPYAVNSASGSAHFDAARPILTNEVIAPIIAAAPSSDLLLSGGWLYVMRDAGFKDAVKSHADPDVLREQFELVAQLEPLLGKAAAERAAHPNSGKKGTPSPQDAETDRRAREYVQKLMADEQATNPGAN